MKPMSNIFWQVTQKEAGSYRAVVCDGRGEDVSTLELLDAGETWPPTVFNAPLIRRKNANLYSFETPIFHKKEYCKLLQQLSKQCGELNVRFLWEWGSNTEMHKADNKLMKLPGSAQRCLLVRWGFRAPRKVLSSTALSDTTRASWNPAGTSSES